MLKKTSILAAISLLTATPVVAGLSCTDINAYSMPSIGSYINVGLNSGEEVTVTAGSGSSAYVVEVGTTIEKCGFIYGGASCAGHVFSAGTTGTYTIEKTGGPVADTLDCAVGSGSSTTTTTTTKAGFRPAKYTKAPDLIPSNIATCDGRFVSGFQILGRGRIARYVEAKYANACFNFDVTVLPQGVSAKNMSQVLEYLGSSDYDVFQ